MTTSRRNFLKLTGGLVAGAAISPLPFKLIDDAAIWSQNWSWLNPIPRGPVGRRHVTCALCPLGCGLQLQTVNGLPFSAWPVPNHPVSRGGVCPAGLGSIQMHAHPARLRAAVKQMDAAVNPWATIALGAAIADVAKSWKELREHKQVDQVAVLSSRPDRSLTAYFAEVLKAAGGGKVIEPPSGLTAMRQAFSRLIAEPADRMRVDLRNARILLAFGAPVFEEWTQVGRLDPTRTFTIQAEPNLSPSAARADRWLSIAPGSEAALALGLAHLVAGLRPQPAESFLADSGLRELVAGVDVRETSRITRLVPADLAQIAELLVTRGPTLAVGLGKPGAGPLGVEEEMAIVCLNAVLGNFEQAGLVKQCARYPFEREDQDASVPVALEEIPDHSLRLLFIDGNQTSERFPWELVARKLLPDARVVGLSPYLSDQLFRADVILPTLAYGEWIQDVRPAWMGTTQALALADSFVKKPKGIPHPASLFADLARAAGVELQEPSGKKRMEAMIRERVTAIMDAGAGQVFTPENGKLQGCSEFGSADDLVKAMRAGAVWVDEKAAAESLPVRVRPVQTQIHHNLKAVAEGRLHLATKPPGKRALKLVVQGLATSLTSGAVPPVLSKLYRESGLRLASNVACVHPDTADLLGLVAGRPMKLETVSGRIRVRLAVDPAVTPGCVLMASGPGARALGDVPVPDQDDVFDLSLDSQTDCWRVAWAQFSEV